MSELDALKAEQRKFYQCTCTCNEKSINITGKLDDIKNTMESIQANSLASNYHQHNNLETHLDFISQSNSELKDRFEECQQSNAQLSIELQTSTAATQKLIQHVEYQQEQLDRQQMDQQTIQKAVNDNVKTSQQLILQSERQWDEIKKLRQSQMSENMPAITKTDKISSH